ncbi:MAG: hypothetical protein IKS47_04385 [Bacteroidales bacterium]|nr:hypothetical protein [Bacteroidales bacterium]
MVKKLLILLIAMLALVPARAQYYQTGGDPSGARWNRLSGEHFDVIYPREIDSLAREFLYAFERDRSADLAGLRIQSERVPMILHPYDMNSNGLVVWAPKRTELMTTPPFKALYPMDWETQLSVHEGRHLGQMAHYTTGIYRVLMVLTGEQGISLGVGFYPSKTLLEGDAVLNETDLTGAGRGRDPEFLKFFRAAFLEKDFRKYDNWRYGSYRLYTPNKYAFGYLIGSTMRDNSGNYHVTGDIMEEQVRSWWRFFSVSHRSYQRGSGLTSRKNWRLAVSRFTETWSWEYKMRAPYTPLTQFIPERPRLYTEFDNPLPLASGLYTTMSGIQDEMHLVRIDTLGGIHRRHAFSSNTSSLVPDGDGALFSEIVPDPRWEHRNWSVIRRYDARKNRIETLTHKTRFVNPVPTADGDAILAIDYRVTGGSDVVILDREGRLLDRIAAPAGAQALNAARLGGTLYVSGITHEGAAIYRYGEDGWQPVLGPRKKAIRDLQAAGDSLLYFVSDLDGLSNVYTFNPAEGEASLTQITTVTVSAAHPYLDSTGTLYFANYDARGYRPVSADAASLDHKQNVTIWDYDEPVAERNALQAEDHLIPASEEELERLRSSIDSLESEPYSKFLHGVHIHSWFPFYANVRGFMNDLGRFNLDTWYQFIAPGATLVSQNNLGTAVATLGYSWHREQGQGYHAAHLNVSYSGLYPVIETSVDFNDRPRLHTTYYINGNGTRKLVKEKSLNALTASALVYVPLNLSKGGWNRALTPQLRYILTNDLSTYVLDDRELQLNTTHALRAGVSYYSHLSQPTARLKPRLGFGVSAIGEVSLVKQYIAHEMEAVNAYAYLPGFFKIDNFKLTYNYQHQNGFSLSRDNLVKMPRGYDSKNYFLHNYHGFSVDYAVPINTNGISGGWFFYVKRFQLIPFADYGFQTNEHFFSFGGTFMINTYLFRIGTELKLGVQYARTLEGRNQFRFVLSSGL